MHQDDIIQVGGSGQEPERGNRSGGGGRHISALMAKSPRLLRKWMSYNDTMQAMGDEDKNRRRRSYSTSTMMDRECKDLSVTEQEGQRGRVNNLSVDSFMMRLLRPSSAPPTCEREEGCRALLVKDSSVDSAAAKPLMVTEGEDARPASNVDAKHLKDRALRLLSFQDPLVLLEEQSPFMVHTEMSFSRCGRQSNRRSTLLSMLEFQPRNSGQAATNSQQQLQQSQPQCEVTTGKVTSVRET